METPEVQLAAIRTLYRIPSDQNLIEGLHKRFSEKVGPLDTPAINKAVQECLLTSDPLLAFAAWYHTWLYGNMAWAQHWGVTETKLGMGLTLFKVKPFQVQLFLFKPGATIPEHVHPDVESYEVYIAGDMELTKDGLNQTIREFVKANQDGRTMCNGGMIRIPSSCVHGGWVNNLQVLETLDEKRMGHGVAVKSHLIHPGGAFISIQYWKKGMPVSIQYNWRGVDGAKQG